MISKLKSIDSALGVSAAIETITPRGISEGSFSERSIKSVRWMIGLQVKARIIVSFVQVLTSLGVVFSIPYPVSFSSMVAWMGVFSLDFLTVMPIGCTIDMNHDHFLLIRTLVPLFLLFVSFQYRWKLKRSALLKRNRKEARADEELADRLLTYNFVLLYLLFPSNSANIFATFQCETFDDAQASSFLRKDLSVDCKSPFHTFMMVYAALMIFVYPIGVPALYAYLLFYLHGSELRLLRQLELKRVGLHRDKENTAELASARASIHASARTVVKAVLTKSNSRLTPQDLRRRHSHGNSSGIAEETEERQLQEMQEAEKQDEMHRLEVELQNEEDRLRAKLPDYVKKLILGYELRTFYFEIIECFRKLAIVCLPVFFRPSGSVGQLIFGLTVCFITFGTHVLYRPYDRDGDDVLAQLCQVQIFFALESSIALKFDPATLDDSTNMDLLLSMITPIPFILALFLQIPARQKLSAFVWEQSSSLWRRWTSGTAPARRPPLHRPEMLIANIQPKQGKASKPTEPQEGSSHASMETVSHV